MGKSNFKNKYFVIAEVISLIATLGICYIPITAKMFGLVPLSLTDLLYVFGFGSLGLLVLPELFMRRRVWRWK
jgi:magnesium-transporting ATPase (P-type)